MKYLLTGLFFPFIGFSFKKYHEYKICKDLHPYWTKVDIKKYTKNYVSAKGQDITPSEKEELKSSLSHYSRQELMPFFLDTAFADEDENIHYIILADSGMGKTAFLINLYDSYLVNRLSFHKLKFWKLLKPTFDILLFPLGEKDVLKKVTSIPDDKRKNTILLLDVFDEDLEALKDYKKRLEEIIESSKGFRDILITCRTQFFPSEENEPRRTGVLKFGTEKGEYEFKKKYLSPFDESDVDVYLRKKYGVFRIWNWKKKKQARKIVNDIPYLRVRPVFFLILKTFKVEIKHIVLYMRYMKS